MLKAKKEQVVAELVERLRASDTLMVADYRGLDVTQLNDVRTELLKHGARFSIVKNTLAKRAAEEAGLSSLIDLLDGPTAIAFVGEGDMVGVAKALSDAARETKIISVKGGILDGEPISADQVKNLASLPPTDVLRGQVLAAIIGPAASIVGIFSAPLRDFVGVVDARIRQLEEQGELVEPPEPDAPVAEEAPTAEAEAEVVPEAEESPVETPAAEAESETTNGSEEPKEEEE